MELTIEIIKTDNIENFQKPIEVLSKRNSIENIVIQQRINSLDSSELCNVIEIKNWNKFYLIKYKVNI